MPVCVCVLCLCLCVCVQEVTHYLVKWCSLSYEEATWELQEDVDPGKILEFEEIQKLPDLKHVRSEARRVGKECRYRWSPYP